MSSFSQFQPNLFKFSQVDSSFANFSHLIQFKLLFAKLSKDLPGFAKITKYLPSFAKCYKDQSSLANFGPSLGKFGQLQRSLVKLQVLANLSKAKFNHVRLLSKTPFGRMCQPNSNILPQKSSEQCASVQIYNISLLVPISKVIAINFSKGNLFLEVIRQQLFVKNRRQQFRQLYFWVHNYPCVKSWKIYEALQDIVFIQKPSGESF